MKNLKFLRQIWLRVVSRLNLSNLLTNNFQLNNKDRQYYPINAQYQSSAPRIKINRYCSSRSLKKLVNCKTFKEDRQRMSKREGERVQLLGLWIILNLTKRPSILALSSNLRLLRNKMPNLFHFKTPREINNNSLAAPHPQIIILSSNKWARLQKPHLEN